MTNIQNEISPNFVDFDFTGPEPLAGRVTLAGELMLFDAEMTEAFRSRGVQAVRVELDYANGELRVRPVEPTDQDALPIQGLEQGQAHIEAGNDAKFDGFSFDGFWHQDDEWKGDGFCFDSMPLQIEANREALAAA